MRWLCFLAVLLLGEGVEFPRWVPERDGRTTDEEWDVVRQLHEAHAIYIGRSEIHGVGLLAARGFAKGEAVFKFLYDPNERMQWVRMDVLAQYFTPAHKALLHNFWARNETHLYAPAFMTNPAQITSWVHYLNHHAAPNIAYDHPTGCYYALKNIAVQEEILIDYRTYSPGSYAYNIKDNEHFLNAQKQDSTDETNLL